MLKRYFTVVLAALCTGAVLASPAQAEYEGQTVTILVNYPSGGPTDIEARILAQFLGNHIPGNPTVVVNNMPGGGGNIAANHMGEVAPGDPNTISYFTWNPIDQIMGAEGLRVDYSDFQIVAGFQQPVIAYMRKDVDPGIEEPADIAEASGFNVATLAPNNHITLRQAWALDLLGVDYNLVAGYTGLRDVETAILQGEAHFAAGSIAGYRGSIESTMVEPGIVIPVFHFDIQDEAGEFTASEAVPEIPTFTELYREVRGNDELPSGLEWEALTLVGSIMDSLYRTVFMGPDVPDDKVAIMREAITAVGQDPEFIEAYQRTVGIPPTLVVGAQAEQIIAGLGDLDPELVDFINTYVAQLGD